MTHRVSVSSFTQQFSTLSLGQANHFTSLCAANKLQQARDLYDPSTMTCQTLTTALTQAYVKGSADTTLWLSTLRIGTFSLGILLPQYLSSITDKVLSSGNNSERKKPCDADAIFKAFEANEYQYRDGINRTADGTYQATPCTRYFSSFCASGNLAMLKWLHEQNPSHLKDAFFLHSYSAGAANRAVRGIDILYKNGHIDCLDWLYSQYPTKVHATLFLANAHATLFSPIASHALHNTLPLYQWLHRIDPQGFLLLLKQQTQDGLNLFQEVCRTTQDPHLLQWLHTITQGTISQKPKGPAGHALAISVELHELFFEMCQKRYIELATALLPWLEDIEQSDNYPQADLSNLLSKDSTCKPLVEQYMHQASDNTLATFLFNLSSDNVAGTHNFWQGLSQSLIDRCISVICRTQGKPRIKHLSTLYHLTPTRVIVSFHTLLSEASSTEDLWQSLGHNFEEYIRNIYWVSDRIQALIHDTPFLRDAFAFSEDLWPYLEASPNRLHPLNIVKLLDEHQFQLLTDYLQSAPSAALAALLQQLPKANHFVPFWTSLHTDIIDKALQALYEHGVLSSLMRLYPHTPDVVMEFLLEKLVSSSAHDLLMTFYENTTNLLRFCYRRSQQARDLIHQTPQLHDDFVVSENLRPYLRDITNTRRHLIDWPRVFVEAPQDAKTLLSQYIEDADTGDIQDMLQDPDLKEHEQFQRCWRSLPEDDYRQSWYPMPGDAHINQGVFTKRI